MLRQARRPTGWKFHREEGQEQKLASCFSPRKQDPRPLTLLSLSHCGPWNLQVACTTARALPRLVLPETCSAQRLCQTRCSGGRIFRQEEGGKGWSLVGLRRGRARERAPILPSCSQLLSLLGILRKGRLPGSCLLPVGWVSHLRFPCLGRLRLEASSILL